MSLVSEVSVADLPLRGRYRLDVALEQGSSASVSVPLEVLVGAAHRPCLGLVAGVHGDEYDGILALQEILCELDPTALEGTMLVIPVANPLAFSAGQRTTPDDGLDLNRVFPGQAEGSITERLAELLCEKLLRQADFAFTLHSAGSAGLLSPWVEFLDVPGPLGRASYEMARASGFSDLIALPRMPGVLLTAMAELGVPLIEGEVGGRGATCREDVRFYKERVAAVARHVGVLAGSSPASEGREAPRIWHLHSVAADAAGLFLRDVSLRQPVRCGDRLGTVVDRRGIVVAEVRAPQDGLVGGYREHAGVRPGQQVITLWSPAIELHADEEVKL